MHGTRTCYKAGCRELRCRAANAAYHAARRRQRAHGRQGLGSLVPAGMTWRRIHALQGEGYTLSQIAQMLGLQTLQVRLHTDRVTLKSFMKVRALYRRIMLDDFGSLPPVGE